VRRRIIVAIGEKLPQIYKTAAETGHKRFRGRSFTKGLPMADGPATTGVICKRCGTAIAVNAAERVTEEFAVTCPKCGHRAFYLIKDIKTIERR